MMSRLFIWILVLFCLASCSSVYRPSAAYIPQVDSTATANVDLAAGGGGNQVIVSKRFNDHFAIFGKGLYDASKARVLDTINQIKDVANDYVYYSGELGASFNYRINQASFGVVVSGGYGWLASSSNGWFEDRWERPITANSLFTYITPFFSYRDPFQNNPTANVETTFGARLAMLHYIRVVGPELVQLHDAGTDYFIEPLAKISVGGKKYRFGAYGGLSIPIKKTVPYDAQRLILGLNVLVNLNELSDPFEDDLDDAYEE